ncbi:helix-turn-helix domain-containing protein [Shimia biformata]|uniref:helix-turn-helix domain-containing protein n=1 Tax=Shimia biformata TaxID=1294299 RepID=UPI0019509644|nr:helix-turn-helix transcriptional regulator [Shimia biformata]
MSDFPQALKTWRSARRYSQLTLALEAGISSRHLSFLETGRARPSREMVDRLAESLRLPLDAHNRMLVAAGFAAKFSDRDWSDDQMAPIRQAVDHMLVGHMPFPGIALDRLWTIRAMNRAAAAIFGGLGLGDGDSMLEFLASDLLPGMIENWPEVAHHTSLRLRAESMAQGGIPEFDSIIDHLDKAGLSARRGAMPVVPTILRFGDQSLAMFSTIAQFGTPEDITLDDLRIELFFPMDATTAAAFEAISLG